jgi:hypothetical protein
VKTAFGTAVKFKSGRVAAAIAFLAAVAAVTIWALPRGIVAGRAEAAVSPPISARSDEPVARPALLVEDPSKPRAKATCAECGIIESVQRIETPMAFTGWCDETEIARTQNSGKSFGREYGADREPLRDTVAAAIAESRGTTKEPSRLGIASLSGCATDRGRSSTKPRREWFTWATRIVVIAGASKTHG